MYIGLLLVLLGEAALFRSASLLMYTAAFAVLFHLFVVLYEGLQNCRSCPTCPAQFRIQAALATRAWSRFTHAVRGAG
jgi:hypothetical protein